MDALVDRVKRLSAGLLVVSTLDTLVVGASTSAELARDVLRVLAAVAADFVTGELTRRAQAALREADGRVINADEIAAQAMGGGSGRGWPTSRA